MIEGAEMVGNMYLQGGSVIIIVICFVGLLVWVMVTSAKREDRLYTIIDVLSAKLEVLPHMREELEEIKQVMKVFNRHG